MVHFKLTAAAAAILAPTVMGAAATCVVGDKFVVQRCDFGTSSTACATTDGVGCTNMVSTDCHYVAASKYLKMSATTTAGVVTFSMYTDAQCSVAATPASVTRVTYGTGMVAATDCIHSTAAGTAAATDIMFGETATGDYTYQMHCGAGTTLMSESAAITVYAATSPLSCATASATADLVLDPVIASSVAAGFCTRTGAATSTQTKCTTAGALSVQFYGDATCAGTAKAYASAGGGTYLFTAASACDNGCDHTVATCYSALDATALAANAATNVIPRKTGATICTTLTNVASAPAPAASPAGIASAALAAVVGLGYLFF